MPKAGSQSRLTENSKINSIASQNGGIAYSNKAPWEINPSSQCPLRRARAASTPNVTPSTDDTTNAEPINASVAGKRSLISDHTDVWLR